MWQIFLRSFPFSPLVIQLDIKESVFEDVFDYSVQIEVRVMSSSLFNIMQCINDVGSGEIYERRSIYFKFVLNMLNKVEYLSSAGATSLVYGLSHYNQYIYPLCPTVPSSFSLVAMIQ